MKIISILLLNFLTVSAEESIAWEPIRMLKSCSDEYEHNTVYLVPNGDVHLFRDCSCYSRLKYIHQIKYANGTLGSFKILDEDRTLHYAPINFTSLSIEGSKDGKHLIFTYYGSRGRRANNCNKYNDSGCIDVLYIESFNGGKDWTEPLLLPKQVENDRIHRYNPSIVYEKDTGRIYIVYTSLQNFSISVREPNKSTFEYPITTSFPDKMTIEKLKFLQTFDRETSNKYLHLFFAEKMESSIYYTRSSDGGKTWTKFTKFLEKVTINDRLEVIAGIEAAESTIYIQYHQSPDIKVMFSKDNGFSWESPFKSGSDLKSLNSLAICGNKEKAYVISVHNKIGIGNEYIRCNTIYERYFRNLNYPFTKFISPSQPNIRCIYNDKNQYNVTALLIDNKRKLTYMAQGVMST